MTSRPCAVFDADAAVEHAAGAPWINIVAWTLWVGLVEVCAVVSFLKPDVHSVYPIYSHVGGEWLAGRDIYVIVPQLDFFRYSPLAAAFFVPWRMLDDAWGGAIWRILGAILLAGGLAAWGRTALPSRFAPPRLGLLFILIWPLALQNINNGQANVHLVGFVLFGMADFAKGRYWRASLAFAAAVLFKPYVLALVGLLILIDRRLLGRFVLTLAAGLALPFALQSPDYVLNQYDQWLRHFAGNDRSWMGLRSCYRDLLLLCRVYGLPLKYGAYQLIEVIAGLGMAGLILAGKRAGWSRQELLTRSFALASCWMTALGPATESCTYLVLGPAAAAAAFSRPGISGRWVRIACGLLLAPVAAGLFPGDWKVHAYGPQPVAGMILLTVITRECLLALRKSPSITAGATRVAA